jgi:hypothetical protein
MRMRSALQTGGRVSDVYVKEVNDQENIQNDGQRLT